MDDFSFRKYIISGVIILIGFIFIIRLFYIQIIESRYKHSAENNSQRTVIQYPARGLIYDRDGNILVYNQAAYDLMIIPKQVKKFDTTLLCNVLALNKNALITGIKKAKKHSYYKPSVLVKQITAEQYAKLMEILHKYPGMFMQSRTLRKYPRKIASHVLGYIGEVNDKITKINPYYKPGDYIGISGLECSYEKALRGEKGVKKYLVDVHNRIQGSYLDGAHDTVAVIGKNLISTLDAELQEYGEYLMRNKVGSIVAIEPKTGEVLAFISNPSYDPNLMVGNLRSKYYENFKNDTLKPLFNRAMASRYSPGSIFKIVQALVGLQEGVITEETGASCGEAPVKCHNHPSAANLKQAIQFSCNPYFYKVFRKIILHGFTKNLFEDSRTGLEEWRKYVLSMGFGKPLKIDIPGSSGGLIPDCGFYDKWYGKGRWAFSTIYSNSIGQGEVITVPLQIANFAAVIANNGYYITPHFVKAIEGQKNIDAEYTGRHISEIDSKHFEVITQGMYQAVNEAGGTAYWGAKLDSIKICGKTGTVQNVKGKKDHSGFMSFAPMEEPKIAIVVYVENAGFGGVIAAPIASLMIEKYLTGQISDTLKEKRILEFQAIN